MSAEHTQEHAHEHASMTKRKIWQVFFYLLGITALEFIIALYLIPKGIVSHGVGNFAYISLTLVKAFYIVAYFMHLKFEKFAFKASIVLSLLFIIYFIVLMLIEGNYIHLQSY
ncbi:MAG: cytochrome C oxidase subunit IV family protein [Sphingobacteriales bacterium]|nr:cytochrome C oxidase subunit IV family protein [Sphingobacteriales bacterium]